MYRFFYVPATKLADQNSLSGLANIIFARETAQKELSFCSDENA